MQKTSIKNIETDISKSCDVLRKTENILEVVIEETNIKLVLTKKNNMYVGKYKEMEFISTGD